jgi:hypothetical protein
MSRKKYRDPDEVAREVNEEYYAEQRKIALEKKREEKKASAEKEPKVIKQLNKPKKVYDKKTTSNIKNLLDKIYECRFYLKLFEDELRQRQHECEHDFGTPIITHHDEVTVCDDGQFGFTYEYEDKTWTCKRCYVVKKESKRINYPSADCQKY